MCSFLIFLYVCSCLYNIVYFFFNLIYFYGKNMYFISRDYEDYVFLFKVKKNGDWIE